MDYYSRLTLAIIFGGGTGYFLSNFLPLEPISLIIVGSTIGIATDTTLRTMKNVKIESNIFKNQEKTSKIIAKPRQKAPDKPKF